MAPSVEEIYGRSQLVSLCLGSFRSFFFRFLELSVIRCLSLGFGIFCWSFVLLTSSWRIGRCQGIWELEGALALWLRSFLYFAILAFGKCFEVRESLPLDIEALQKKALALLDPT
jgi:hypothetical protein